jgi:hypothetical protein
VRYIAIILWYRLTGALEGCSDEAFATGADGEVRSRRLPRAVSRRAAVDRFLGGQTTNGYFVSRTAMRMMTHGKAAANRGRGGGFFRGGPCRATFAGPPRATQKEG